jgi:hypothetical protein
MGSTVNPTDRRYLGTILIAVKLFDTKVFEIRHGVYTPQRASYMSVKTCQLVVYKGLRFVHMWLWM